MLTSKDVKSTFTALDIFKILRKPIAAKDSVFDRQGNMPSECHIISWVLPLSYITSKTHATLTDKGYHSVKLMNKLVQIYWPVA